MKPAAGTIRVQRFTVIDRVMHLVLMFSFLALAGTGLPLFFADRRWAQILADLLGGYGVTGALHRIAAVVMFVVFFAHLIRVGARVFGKESGASCGARIRSCLDPRTWST